MIRWEDIQNLIITEDEINNLAGLTVSPAELNILDGYTGTTSDLNDIIGLGSSLTSHLADDMVTAHAPIAGSLDGLIIAAGTITEDRLAFDTATQAELDVVDGRIDAVISDLNVERGRIDSLYSVVFPGQGNDIADAIQQTLDHIDNPSDAHDASAISYGELESGYYTLTADILAAATNTILPTSILKYLRENDTISFDDDVSIEETVTLDLINYTTGYIEFSPATTVSFLTANNSRITNEDERNVQEAVERSFRDNGETEIIIREGVYTGTIDTQTLTADRTWTLRDEDIILGNPAITGNALSVLRVNAGATDVEWHDLTAVDIDFNNAASGLAATDVQTALDEIDGNLDTHIADTSIHFTEASISHLNILDIGFKSHITIDNHIDDTTIHFTEGSIDHENILNKGTNTHDDIDTHINDTTIHFSEGSIDHENLLNKGTNTHATIDAHILDLTIHRSINDAGSAATDLWSADKIITQLATKSDSAHTHGIDDLTDVDTTTSAPSPGEHLEWDGANWIPGTSGEVNTASNLGGGNGVFNSKVGFDLQFKSLIQGSNITLTPTGTDITIAATGVGEANTASNVGGANGIYKQKTGIDLEFLTLAAGANMTITPVGDTLVVASTASGGGGGTSIDRTQATHGFAVLDTIYHNGTLWAKAQADDSDTLGEYVVSEVTDVNNFTANKFGEITVAAHGKTVGEHYFLSATVAGSSDINEPDDFSCPVFYVEDANTIHVEVYRPSEITEVVSETTKYQTKTTSSSVSTTGVISDLTFNNLEIGKTYRISGALRAWVTGSTQAGNNQTMIHVKDGSSVVTRMNVSDWTNSVEGTLPCTAIFVATANTLTFDVITLLQSNQRLDGYAHLEELPFHQATAQWT